MAGLCQLKKFEFTYSKTTNRHIPRDYVDDFLEDFLEINDLIDSEPTQQDNMDEDFIEIDDLIGPEPTYMKEDFIEIDDLIGPEPTHKDNVDELFIEIDDLIGSEPTHQDNVDEHFIEIDDLIVPEPSQQNNVDELSIEDIDGLCELYLFEDVSMFLQNVGNSEAAQPAWEEERNVQVNGVQPCFFSARPGISHLLETKESAYLC